MSTEVLICSVMTSFPHSIDINAALEEAQGMMREHQIRHIPVKDGDDLVGLITDRDIKLVLGPNVGAADDGHGPRVRQASRFDIYKVEMATPLRDVVSTMAEERIGSALITKEGRLAGIFTVTDACRCLAELLGGSPGISPTTDDAA